MFFNKRRYWDEYKKNNPEKAKQIVLLTNENFDDLSENDVCEKIHSIETWSAHSGVPINKLEEDFLSKTDAYNISIDEIRDCINHIESNNLKEEAVTRGISPNNTIAYYTIRILKSYYQKRSQKLYSVFDDEEIERITIKELLPAMAEVVDRYSFLTDPFNNNVVVFELKHVCDMWETNHINNIRLRDHLGLNQPDYELLLHFLAEESIKNAKSYFFD